MKTAGGFFAGTMIHPDECRRPIRDGVKRGVERRGELNPYTLTRPVELELTLRRPVDAEVASYLRGVERPKGNVIVYRAEDMPDAARFVHAIGYLKVP